MVGTVEKKRPCSKLCVCDVNVNRSYFTFCRRRDASGRLCAQWTELAPLIAEKAANFPFPGPLWCDLALLKAKGQGIKGPTGPTGANRPTVLALFYLSHRHKQTSTINNWLPLSTTPSLFLSLSVCLSLALSLFPSLLPCFLSLFLSFFSHSLLQFSSFSPSCCLLHFLILSLFLCGKEN